MIWAVIFWTFAVLMALWILVISPLQEGQSVNTVLLVNGLLVALVIALLTGVAEDVRDLLFDFR